MQQIEKREYQERIIGKVSNAFNDKIDTALIESPTGAGKTIMAMSIIKQFADRGWKIGWMAMRRELLRQARKENNKFFGIENIEFISMFQREIPTDIDMLVFDECQHSPADTAITAISKMRPKKVLGMTATPYRTDRMNLCFQKVVKDASIHMLIQQGYLSPFEHFVIPRWSPADVATVYASDPARWGKSVVFFLTITDCYRCQRELAKRGVESEVVTGETDRERQLERFENGEIPVLINVYILTEGFDCPELQTVWVRPSQKGPTIQMSGRAFRIYPDKTHCNVVQCKETHYPFTRHATAMNCFHLEQDKWLSVKGNENVDKAQLLAIRAIAQSEVEMPSYITQKKKKSRYDLDQMGLF